MVNFNFYGEIRDCPQIPENYYDFIQIIGVLFNLDNVEKLILEYTFDSKTYYLLTEETYNNFFLNGHQSTVFIYSSFEESKTYQMQKQKEQEKKQETVEEPKIEEKEEEEEINTDNKDNDNNDNQEIKVPEVTKDMVIASILKQVRENMQKSRILLQQKEKEEKERKEKEEKEERERKEKEEKERKEREKKEKEETKAITDQISNLIANRLDNLKQELINESQIKCSEIMSESQLNLKNLYENNDNNNKQEKVEIIRSLEEHPGISCSKCGMNPIIGNRYSCVYCNNVNFCDKCEENEGLIHGHPLYKLKLRI